MSCGRGSKFVVLADVQEDVVTNLDFLKQKIKNIPCRLSSSGHEKAYIKLEKGLNTSKGSWLTEGLKSVGL